MVNVISTSPLWRLSPALNAASVMPRNSFLLASVTLLKDSVALVGCNMLTIWSTPNSDIAHEKLSIDLAKSRMTHLLPSEQSDVKRPDAAPLTSWLTRQPAQGSQEHQCGSRYQHCLCRKYVHAEV